MSTSELTITVSPDGSVEWLGVEELEALTCLGPATRRRVSHIEPCDPILRVLFRLVRRVVSDGGRVAAWTRAWRCRWRIDIIGGPTFGGFSDRHEAIEREHRWLNERGAGE